jgi:hypothetical protein
MTRIPYRRPQCWLDLARVLFVVLVIYGSSATALSAGTITYQFTNVGPNNYQYTYLINGFNLTANQEIYIPFDPAVYLSLSNGTAGSDFSLVVLQPNDPMGAPGVYSALATVDNPSLAGPFSVDVSFIGGSGQGASQPFAINQWRADGSSFYEIASGLTSAVSPGSNVPEPATGLLVGVLALLPVGLRFARRR